MKSFFYFYFKYYDILKLFKSFEKANFMESLKVFLPKFKYAEKFMSFIYLSIFLV